jgi:hypothetical protein
MFKITYRCRGIERRVGCTHLKVSDEFTLMLHIHVFTFLQKKNKNVCRCYQSADDEYEKKEKSPRHAERQT